MEKRDSKSLDRRFWEEAFCGGRLPLVDELVDGDCVLKDPGMLPYTGPEEIKEFISSIHGVYPETEIKLRGQSVEGDRVVSRWRFDGASGNREDVPERITILGTSTTRVANDKIQSIDTDLSFEAEISSEERASSWWCRIVRC